METTLFDWDGIPVAYIAPQEDNSIYLWNGKAVCYLVDDKIYGWRGQHIGWFVGGIVYDRYGYREGFIRSQCPVIPKLEPLKTLKQLRYIRYIRSIPYIRPFFKTSRADMELGDFLSQNMV